MKHSERDIVRVENPEVADGVYYREVLAEKEWLEPHLNQFAKITVEPGVTMFPHSHTVDSELYYILKGVGEYNDNGTIIPCEPGDSFFCPVGGTHSISNTGDEPMEFIAVIVKK